MLNLLHFYISTFQSVCAVPNMAVFCSSLISCFPGMLLRYFLNDFDIVPVAPIITDITFVFTFHMRCISIAKSLYFVISRLPSLSHFSLPNLQHLLAYLLLFHYAAYDVLFIVMDGVSSASSLSEKPDIRGRLGPKIRTRHCRRKQKKSSWR